MSEPWIRQSEVQDVEDEDEMYEPLLDDTAVETLMEDNTEIETGSRDELRGVQLEHPALRDQGKLAAQERPGTSGEAQVDERSLLAP